MTLPPRIKKPKKETRLRSPGHLRWVRSHVCCVGPMGCDGPIEAAHVRSGTDGGMGMKPGDNWTISLCAKHHRGQHTIGEAAFERLMSIDMKAMAQLFWRNSPHGERKQRAKPHPDDGRAG